MRRFSAGARTDQRFHFEPRKEIVRAVCSPVSYMCHSTAAYYWVSKSSRVVYAVCLLLISIRMFTRFYVASAFGLAFVSESVVLLLTITQSDGTSHFRSLQLGFAPSILPLSGSSSAVAFCSFHTPSAVPIAFPCIAAYVQHFDLMNGVYYALDLTLLCIILVLFKKSVSDAEKGAAKARPEVRVGCTQTWQVFRRDFWYHRYRATACGNQSAFFP